MPLATTALAFSKPNQGTYLEALASISVFKQTNRISRLNAAYEGLICKYETLREQNIQSHGFGGRLVLGNSTNLPRRSEIQ